MRDDEAPPIAQVQNTPAAKRLIAAQARLYSDAKRLHAARVLTVIAISSVTIALALAMSPARAAVGSAGGAIAFLWSLLGGRRERRLRRDAACVQEAFDTYVFSLPWNDVLLTRPSPTLIAEAAARYDGNRTEDWYPDTQPVRRPLAVLICQRTNLGWGASMHRLYAACLTGALLAVAVAGIAVAVVLELSSLDAMTAVLVPLLAPSRELVELIGAHRESAEAKSEAENAIETIWQRALHRPRELHLADCRAVQDRIYHVRRTNADVPDWLDNLRRNRNETLMQETAQQLVEEAGRHGWHGDPRP